MSSAARREFASAVAAVAIVYGGVELWSRAESPRQTASPALAAPTELALGQGVADYTLEAVLDTDAHVVRGRGVIRWRNASTKPQHELWLHTYLNAFKSSRSRFLRGGPTRGFRGGGVLAHHGSLDVTRLFAREFDADIWPTVTYGTEDDETDARVTLPRPVMPGESLTLDVEFTASLPTLLLRTGYVGSFHMVGQWFPKIARLEADGTWAHFALSPYSEFYADFGDYDVVVDVPESFTVGATGAPRGSEVSGGRRRLRFFAPRVHDFAFSAWDGFEEIRQMAGDVELAIVHPRGERGEAELELEVTTKALAHFEERYGRYPYPRLTLVRPPAEAAEAGGMEYPTLITTGASSRYRMLGLRSIEAITVHELAHQWFYGLVASNENAHPFLDEGLTSYAEIEAMDALWPGRSGFDAFGLQVSEAAAYRVFGVAAEARGPIDRPASEFSSGRDYAALVYGRAATALATLARVYGELPMTRALRNYATTWRFAHPVPADLVAAVRAEMGEAAAAALEAMLRGETLHVLLEGQQSRADGSGYAGTVTVRREGAVVLPVDVEVRTDSGDVLRLRWDGRGERVVLPWQARAPLASVRVDPDDKLLIDARWDSRAAGPRPLPARVWALSTFLAGAAGAMFWQ